MTIMYLFCIGIYILSMCIYHTFLSVRKKKSLPLPTPHSNFANKSIETQQPSISHPNVKILFFRWICSIRYVVNQWCLYFPFAGFLKRSTKFSGMRMHTYWRGLTVRNNVLNCKMFPVTFIPTKCNNTAQHLEYLWKGTRIVV